MLLSMEDLRCAYKCLVIRVQYKEENEKVLWKYANAEGTISKWDIVYVCLLLSIKTILQVKFRHITAFWGRSSGWQWDYSSHLWEVHISRFTRPDIAIAVHTVSIRSHWPTTGGYMLAEKISRYHSRLIVSHHGKRVSSWGMRHKISGLAMIGKANVTEVLLVVGYNDGVIAADKGDRKKIWVC